MSKEEENAIVNLLTEQLHAHSIAMRTIMESIRRVYNINTEACWPQELYAYMDYIDDTIAALQVQTTDSFELGFSDITKQ